MNDIRRFQPAWHKRYNIRAVWWREHKRVALLVFFALLLGVLLKVGEGWLVELNARLLAENSHRSLIASVFQRDAEIVSLAQFGVLTDTDFSEGTGNLRVGAK